MQPTQECASLKPRLPRSPSSRHGSGPATAGLPRRPPSDGRSRQARASHSPASPGTAPRRRCDSGAPTAPDAPTPRSQAADVWLVNAVEVEVDARRKRVEVAGRAAPTSRSCRSVAGSADAAATFGHPSSSDEAGAAARTTGTCWLSDRCVTSGLALAGAEVARRIPVGPCATVTGRLPAPPRARRRASRHSDGGEVQRRPECRHSRRHHTNAERQGRRRQWLWARAATSRRPRPP